MAQLLPENSTLERTIRRAAEQGRLSHAIVLSGTGDLTDAARFIAAAHVCEGTDRPCLRCRHCRKVLEGIHPDVIPVLDTEHKELTVEAVRALRKDVYIRPNEARRKVYVISDCRQLNQRDQDVLLKVVEEGPPYAAFIFCADAPAALLETVRSRCALLKYDGEDAPLSDGTAELCRAFASGRLLPVTTALLSREQSLKRETLQAQLEELWRAAAEALLVQQGKARPDPSCAEAALLLADRLTARQLLGLDKVLLIPAAIPPHKAVAEGSPDGETRLALTKLAIAGEAGMEVSRIELDRPGPSYTVDTLRTLRECYPQDALYLLMGTDMFLSFFQWRDPEHIARLAVPVCMARVRTDEALSAQLLAQQAAMEAAFGVRPIVLQNDCLEISSTEARRLLFFGIADEVLHPDVRSMIERENLYGVGGKYHAMPFDELRRVSLSLHKEKRRAHAQGVSDTAVLLARKYGADETDAARAGILHDITKALSPAQQQKLVDHWKLPVSPFEYMQTKLLHAKTGAAAAERIFGEDAAVVSAIDYHTTGRANMTLLEKIIYIADYMEPNRDFPGVDRLRETVWRDLDEGVLLGINMTLEQLAQKGQPACTDSLAARDWLLSTRKEP